MGPWAASRPPRLSPVYFCHPATISQPHYLVFSCGQTLPSSTPFAPYRGVVLISRALLKPPATRFNVSLLTDALSPVLAKCFHFVPAQNEKIFGNILTSLAASRCASLVLCPCRPCSSFPSRDKRNSYRHLVNKHECMTSHVSGPVNTGEKFNSLNSF